MEITYNYRYNTGTHVPDWTAWYPDTSEICSGVEFQQQKDDLGGICDSQYQDATGSWLGDWTTWTPDVSAVCSGTTFQQQKDDLGGICDSQYQQNTGNKLITWTPSTSNYCEGTVFYQTNTCDGSSRQATGISIPNWSPWTPDVSTVCIDEEFTQTRIDLNDKCSPQDRSPVTGIMLDCECQYRYAHGGVPEEIFIPITKSQYESYYRGGTWSATTSISISEYEPGSNGSWKSTAGYASLTYTGNRQQGCEGDLSFEDPDGLAVNFTYHNGPNNSNSFGTQYSRIGASMDYGLVKSGINHFLVIYYMSSTLGRIYSDPINYPCAGKYGAFPPSVQLTLEGVTVSGVGTWCPGWAPGAGYINSSATSASFTFNPSPRP